MQLGASLLDGARHWLSRRIEERLRTEVHLLGRPRSSFHVCGIAGLILSLLLGVSLAESQSRSIVVILVLCSLSVGTFLLQAFITKVLTGEEQLVYYRHEVAIVVGAILALTAWGQPVLPYLDITILGIGAFLVCGRLGCMMVGCCHGRPYRSGVRYRPEHGLAGFTSYYVDVPLFPVQLAEAAWVLFAVIAGVAMVLTGAVPGSAFAWFVVCYDIGRFFFEFMRGDPERRHLLGFSEPQWISVALMAVVVVAETQGVLPFRAWHIVATVGLLVIMIAQATLRPPLRLARHGILNPRHVSEVAQVLESIHRTEAPDGRTVHLGSTSLGLRVSFGKAPNPPGTLYHYTFSSAAGELSLKAAETVAELIAVLTKTSANAELTQGRMGTFHLLIRSEPF